MNKDLVVVDINNKKVIDRKMAPFPLKNDETFKKYDNIIMVWLSKRAMPMDRKNSDKIYQALGLSRNRNEVTLMLTTKGLSINDTFWICPEDKIGTLRWKDINLYDNELSKDISELAFSGSGPATITGNEISAEFTGQGTYAKCFLKGSNNELYVYKRGTLHEVQAEILASYIARVLNMYVIEYKYKQDNDAWISESKIHTNENLSWETAFWFSTYCEESLGGKLFETVERNFTKQYYEMILLDGLVLNSDRHLQNWGIEYNPNTMQIYGLAPNYDFNRAFLANMHTRSPFMSRKNLLSAAKIAEQHLGYDLVSLLIPVAKYLPNEWQEPFINRIHYIMGIKSNQNECY